MEEFVQEWRKIARESSYKEKKKDWEEREWKSRTKIGKNREKPRRIQTMTFSFLNIAKETRNTIDASRAYFNKKSKKNKCR